MNDDIVTLLREDFCDFGQWENSCTPEGKCPCCLAADEIERLRQWAAYEHAGYCGCAGGDPECVRRAYTTWKKMFDE